VCTTCIGARTHHIISSTAERGEYGNREQSSTHEPFLEVASARTYIRPLHGQSRQLTQNLRIISDWNILVLLL